MIIRNRQDFEKYILQTLGEPVIQVNLAREQLQNCIDDATIMFQQFHYDGSIRCFLKQIITPSILRTADDFKPENMIAGDIVGLDSKATASVVTSKIKGRNVSKDRTIYCHRIKGEFKAGEKIKVNGKEYKLIDDPRTFLEKGIIDEHRIKVPDWIIGITHIFSLGQESSSENLFDLQYQIRLNDFLAYDTFHTGDLAYFEQAMEHIDLLNFELNPRISYNFNQYEGYLYPIVKWDFDFVAGQYMLIECIRAINPGEAGKIWNDPWLKKYAVALAKKQWGSNLSKFSGIQLAGGVTFSGSEMLQQANSEIDKLEEQLLNYYPPQLFKMG